ncbi:MAG: hypothetical protein ACJ8GN_14245 [Longimicrobiaceae bacterium]
MQRLLPTLFVCIALAGACVPVPIPAVLPGGGGGGGGGGGAGAVGAAATAAALAAFADSAGSAGCEPLLVGAWRDAVLTLEDESGPEPVSDSIRRLAAEEVGRAMPRIRELCAQSTPRVERLRQIRAELATPPTDGVATPPLFAAVYFARGEREVRDDSVRLRLRALGARLAARPLPMTLVVEGFAEAGDEAAGLGLARANAVLAELRRGGLAPGCCAVVGRPAPADEPAAVARRVTFSLDYREVAR